MASFNTTQLLRMMVLKGSLPDGRFQDQDLLDLAYDCLLSEVVPAVLICREDYYVAVQDLPVIAGQAEYYVPNRAMSGKLREVKMVRGAQVVDLDRIDLEAVTNSNQGVPSAFYLQDDRVVLSPTPVASGDTLRLFYFIRPSRLVTVAECAKITAIDVPGKTVTASLPATWTNALTFDLVRGRGRFDILGLDLTASSVAGSTITFNAALPSTLAVGDYISLAEETCFPFLPPEFHIALTQLAFTSALESMGDPNAVTSAQKAQSLLVSAQSMIKTRVDGAPKPLGTRLL